MTPAAARELALRAFSFIAADPRRAGAFLAACGASPEALGRMAIRPEFPLFIVEFIMESDALVVDFAANDGIASEQIAAARRALGGGDGDWL